MTPPVVLPAPGPAPTALGPAGMGRGAHRPGRGARLGARARALRKQAFERHFRRLLGRAREIELGQQVPLRLLAGRVDPKLAQLFDHLSLLVGRAETALYEGPALGLLGPVARGVEGLLGDGAVRVVLRVALSHAGGDRREISVTPAA